MLGRSQERVHDALEEIRSRLPFPLLGIDSDNDSAFINAHILRYCERKKITFTRSRPYKKNDNAHVEQKNWTCVRKIFGYIRIDTPEQVNLMRKLFRGPLRLYTNFFQPVQKLEEKKKEGSKNKKRYDKAKTPFQRVLESEDVEEKVKEELTSIYQTLNPVSLKKEIDRILEEIYSLSHKSPYSSKRKVRVSDEAVIYSYYG